MKKYAFLIVLISFVGYNLMCSGERKISELVLANIEALASGESLDGDCELGGNGCVSGGLFFPYDREIWK